MLPLFRALWRHAAGRRGMLVGAYALLISAELVRLAVPWFTGQAIDHVQRDGQAGIAPAGQYLLAMFGCIVFGWLLHAPGRMLERNVGMQVRDNFCRELLHRLLRAPLSWHRAEAGAQRAHRVMQGTTGLHNFAESQYIYLQNLVTLIGPLIALAMISVWVGLGAMLGFAMLALASTRFDRTLVTLARDKNRGDRGHQSFWTETLMGIGNVLALRGWQATAQRLSKRLTTLAVPLRKIVVLNEAKWASVDVGSAAVWCGLLALYVWVTPRDVTQNGVVGGVALGSLYMVYEYARRAENVMVNIAADFGQMARQAGDFAALQPILEAPVADHLPVLLPTRWQQLTLLHSQVPGSAAFDVTAQAMSRSCARPCVLWRGRRYALVGSSGSGKSTLLRMLAGLEDNPQSILLDGRSVDAMRLRHEATLIPAENFFVEGTMEENLLFGVNGVLHGNEFARAVQSVCMDEFAHPDHKQQWRAVTEDGANWSGGQRQRVALARGLLAARDSSLVLFDEPISALDAGIRSKVLRGVMSAVADSTLLVSLHNLELLSLFDEVLVMQDGRLIDAGPLDVLRERCAVFRQLEQTERASRQEEAPQEAPQATSHTAGVACVHR